MLSVAHSATQNEFMLLEKMEMPLALLTIREKEGEKKEPKHAAAGRREDIFCSACFVFLYTRSNSLAANGVTRGDPRPGRGS